MTMTKKELMEEVLRLGREVAKWKRLAMYGLAVYRATRLIYFDDSKDVMKRVKELEEGRSPGV